MTAKFTPPVDHGQPHPVLSGPSGRFQRGADEDRLLDALDQLEQRSMSAEQTRAMAVKLAYWQATPADHEDIRALETVLADAGVGEELTGSQLKAAFMQLPLSLVGRGLAWGLTDSEVTEDLETFFSVNRHAVLTAVRDA